MDDKWAALLKGYSSSELWSELIRRNALLVVAGYDVSNEHLIHPDKLGHLHDEQKDYVQSAYIFNAHPQQLG